MEKQTVTKLALLFGLAEQRLESHDATGSSLAISP